MRKKSSSGAVPGGLVPPINRSGSQSLSGKVSESGEEGDRERERRGI